MHNIPAPQHLRVNKNAEGVASPSRWRASKVAGRSRIFKLVFAMVPTTNLVKLAAHCVPGEGPGAPKSPRAENVTSIFWVEAAKKVDVTLFPISAV
jgi:hypothetical protein